MTPHYTSKCGASGGLKARGGKTLRQAHGRQGKQDGLAQYKYAQDRFAFLYFIFYILYWSDRGIKGGFVIKQVCPNTAKSLSGSLSCSN
jgi:hypothetical protein